ncbi:phosphohistidine phosphatase SixA [Denitrificimonas caeni]|uniref:phosphohistidine phosphatase SixA n=1 Tax=Denitrificimonas caeni TaxID=521720 RepID=UPI001962D645|nr:phosphohistidine phosphatase SixA [Denitrificimonas caeni]
MKLWLLRHGAAEPYQRHDAERQLTEQGRQQVVQAAKLLRNERFDRVLSSPYIRARQTAELLCATLQHSGSINIVPWLTPEDDVREVTRKLDGYADEDLLIVAHQPLLGTLVSWLTDADRSHGLPMDTASVACLEGEFIGAGTMQLCSVQHVQS